MPTNPEDTSFISRWSRRKALVRQAEGAPSTPAGVADASQATESAAVPAGPSAAAQVAAATEPSAAPAPIDLTAQATHPTGSDLANPTGAAAAPAQQPPLPTMADVAALTRESDFSRFVARSVQPDVKNAALSKLFTDPHFNVMDGLDTYIDDYGKPDPLPEGMLRKLAHAHVLGLFDHEKETPELTPGVSAGTPAGVAADAEAAAADDLPPATDAASGTDTDVVPHLELESDFVLAPATAPLSSPDSASGSASASAPEFVLAPALASEPAPHENTRLQLQPHDGAGRPGAPACPVQDARRAH
jgi:Protein of unknown function (DUF3306)